MVLVEYIIHIIFGISRQTRVIRNVRLNVFFNIQNVFGKMYLNIHVGTTQAMTIPLRLSPNGVSAVNFV